MTNDTGTTSLDDAGPLQGFVAADSRLQPERRDNRRVLTVGGTLTPHLQRVTTAGTSGATPPNFNATTGGTTTDGTADVDQPGPIHTVQRLQCVFLRCGCKAGLQAYAGRIAVSERSSGRGGMSSLMQDMGARAVRLGIPLGVQLDLTYRCNERCVHCYLDHDDHGELTLAEISGLLDQLADAGVFFLTDQRRRDLSPARPLRHSRARPQAALRGQDQDQRHPDPPGAGAPPRRSEPRWRADQRLLGQA